MQIDLVVGEAVEAAGDDQLERGARMVVGRAPASAQQLVA